MTRVLNESGRPRTHGVDVKVTNLAAERPCAYAGATTITSAVIGASVGEMKGMMRVAEMGLLNGDSCARDMDIEIAIRTMINGTAAFLAAKVAAETTTGVRRGL